MALSLQKLEKEKELSKSVSGYFKTKRNIKKIIIPAAIKLEGVGVEALMARPLKKLTFFAASLSTVTDTVSSQKDIQTYRHAHIYIHK